MGYAQVELRHQHISPAQVHLYQRLSAYLLYPHWSLRGRAELIAQNRLGQSALWRHGISGDLPILLARISEPEHLGFARDLALAQRFWRQRGFKTDLVLINDYPGSYYDAVQDQLINVMRDIHRASDFPGVYVLRGSQLPIEELALLHSVAACALDGEDGTVAQQLDTAQLRAQMRSAELAERQLAASVDLVRSQSPAMPGAPDVSNLEFFNNYGGFADDGREYRIHVDPARIPPAPWSHVVANPRIGFLATESGGGYTWFENSRENKLSPWSNDPISDPSSELLYIRDDVSGECCLPMTFCPTASHANGPLETTYSAGQVTYRRRAAMGLATQVQMSVSDADPVKFFRLTLTNTGQTTRRLTIGSYFELVLGVSKSTSAWQLRTEYVGQHQALLCHNPYHPEYASQVVFATVLNSLSSFTTDRLEFVGRMGSLYQPAGINASELARRVGIDIDPCFALFTQTELQPGQTKEITFLLGAGADRDEAERLLARYRDSAKVADSIAKSQQFWRETLSAIQIQTSNRAMDILANHWLIYQVLACRMWGRSAFYQSVVRMVFAINYRTRWLWCTAARRSPARKSYWQLRVSSSKAMCNTGGILHWARVRARVFRMTCCGCL